MLRNKIAYGICLIAAIAFAYFYPGNISSVYFYTILIVPAVSFFYLFYIYCKLTYLQDVDKKFVTKGEKVCFNVDIANETKILYPYVEVLFYGVDTIFNTHFKTKKIAILPNTIGRYHFELECHYRGYYEMGLKEIKIKDFLGFFSFKYPVFEPKNITVYPRIIPLSRFPIETSKFSYIEGTLNPKEEDMITLSDIRKYAYGDSVKKIHWKLSAKKDELMVKNFDSAASLGVTVILDLSQNHYSVLQNTVLEDKVIEAAVAVVHYALSHHIETHFIYYEDELVKVKAKDYSYFETLYHALFKMKFKSQAVFIDTIKLALEGDTDKNTLILITSNLNDELFSQVCVQHDMGYEVILIYVSEEELVSVEEPIKAKRKAVFDALREMHIKVYEIQISDDIKYILEC